MVPSFVVAPASLYVEPSSTEAGLSPRIVITGKTVSGGVVESSICYQLKLPAKISNCSIIDISIRNNSLVLGSIGGITVPSSSSSSDLIKTFLLSIS